MEIEKLIYKQEFRSMYTYISLLRGINVSGQKKIKMADLKVLYEGLGFANVRTYQQSGNVVFDTHTQDADELAAHIEPRIKQVYGYSVTVFIRQPGDFQRILESNPFVDRPGAQPNRLLVTFLYRQSPEAKLNDLSIPPGTGDEFYIGKREIYLFCPGGYGKSKLSNNFFERKLGVPATTRNWKTVNALYEMGVV
jgi:uncharacterized protein (DUF1697 family)